jgi:hypothetical protein
MERELSQALAKGDKPMAVSAVSSILHKLGTKQEEAIPRRLQYLKVKLGLLKDLKVAKMA